MNVNTDAVALAVAYHECRHDMERALAAAQLLPGDELDKMAMAAPRLPETVLSGLDEAAREIYDGLSEGHKMLFTILYTDVLYLALAGARRPDWLDAAKKETERRAAGQKILGQIPDLPDYHNYMCPNCQWRNVCWPDVWSETAVETAIDAHFGGLRQ